MFVIHWKSGPSAGYSDLLPSWWFETEGQRPSLKHETQNPRGGRAVWKCSLTVEGNKADLDYMGDHAAYNEKHNILGAMRLIFVDGSRSQIQSVQWRSDEPEAKFEQTDAECLDLDIPADVLGIFNPTDIPDGRCKIAKMVTQRQGQPDFRNRLMDAYERRCAISGCDVDEVLQAAHISPYLGEETNHVTNGLLLRADIHTLFDRGLIKVDRDYRIWVSETAKSPFYSFPDEHIHLPKNLALYPNKDALGAKWDRD